MSRNFRRHISTASNVGSLQNNSSTSASISSLFASTSGMDYFVMRIFAIATTASTSFMTFFVSPPLIRIAS